MSNIANETIVHQHKSITLKSVLCHTWVLYTISLFSFFYFWNYVANSGILGSSLAPPSDVASQLYKMLMEVKFAGYSLGEHIWASTRRVVIGFLLAAGFAIPLGLAMALIPPVNAFVKPVFDIFKPMPPIAWVSISLLWFGIGETSKVFIIFIGTFVPCLLNAYNGIRLVDPELYDVIRVLGGTRKDEILQVCFPASFPAVFAGLQIALSMAWTCVLAAELLSSRNGIGFLIKKGMDIHKPELILGGMVIIALTAWITSLLLQILEHKLCPWKRSIEEL